jgi:acetyl-CoA C-acetyltransferase
VKVSEVYITGIGYTQISEHWNKSIKQLALEASINAIKDSNYLKPDVIIVSCSLSSFLQQQESLSNLLRDYLGFTKLPNIRIEAGECSGAAALEIASSMIESGRYKNILVIGVEKPSDRLPQEYNAALSSLQDRDYYYYNGITHASLFALIYKMYMKKYGLKQEDIASFAVHDHKMALNVDYAQYRFSLSIDRILSSPIVAEPIRLFEIFPTSDGAAAVMISSKDQVENKDYAIRLDAITSASDINFVYRNDFLTFYSLQYAFEELRKKSKIAKSDINFLEIHDSYTIAAPLIIENLGFADKNEACRMLKEGEFEKDGSLPLNPSGGLKARGHPIGATPLYQVCEAVLQLRGKASNQVKNAEVGLVQSMNNVADQSYLILLRRYK